MEYVVGSFNTTTGTQDITSGSFGTAVGIIIFCGGVASTVKRSDGGVFCFGMSDGTTDVSTCSASENVDGVTNSNTWRMISKTRLVDMIDPSDGSHDIIAVFDSFIPDGVKINITTRKDTSTKTFIAILIGGDEVDDFYVGADLANGTANTSVGFESDVVLTSGVGLATRTDSLANAFYHIGMAVNDGSDTQKGITGYSQDAVATTNTSNEWRTADMGGQTGAYNVSIGTFTSTGFTMSGATGGDEVIFCCIKLASGYSAEIQASTAPTSTIDPYLITGWTGTPTFAIFLLGDGQLDNTSETDVTYTLAATNGTNITSISFTDNDNVADSAVTTEFNSGLFQSLDNGGTALVHNSDINGFSANTISLDVNTANSPARKWAILAIQQDAASTGNPWGYYAQQM